LKAFIIPITTLLSYNPIMEKELFPSFMFSKNR
jgi:hypothetical protein